MKTVKDFKYAGLVFVADDTCANNPDNKSDMARMSSCANHPVFDDSAVGEFAWRENTGEKPAFNGKIECTLLSGCTLASHCSYIFWSDNIATWRPLLNQSVTAPTETPEEKEALDKIFGADSAPNALNPELVIDWEGKGDGKKYALVNSDKGFVEFFTEKPIKDDDISASSCWLNYESETLHLRGHWELHEKPIKQQSNIYTQEMHDNGVMPSIGMRVSAHTYKDTQRDKWVDAEFIGKAEGCNGGHCLLVKDFNGVTHVIEDDDLIKPITPPTPLINGKAYQFDFNDDKALEGIYYEHVFYCVDNDYSASVCTNIKPLTVKGE